MAGQPVRVTLVGPLPGEGWISIQRYTEAIASLSGRNGFSVVSAPTLEDAHYSRAGAYWARYRRLPRLLERMHPDGRLIHIADQALGHLVPHFPGHPTVVTCHDLMPLTMPGHYEGRFEGWVDRFLLRRSLAGMTRATRIIAVSAFTATKVQEVLGVSRHRVSVVPNMLNDAYSPQANADDWLREAGIRLPPAPRVLSVGHTRPYKDIERLLRAMGAPNLRDATLVRVGAPLTRAQRQLAAQQELEGRLVELGQLDPPVLSRVYAACQVLAQPSRSEGFGVPVAEAMACGLPVVCSDGGALPEVAGGAATIVPAANADDPGVDELAEAIERVLHDAATASMLRERGLARAEAFRPSAIFPLLLAAYERAIEEHRP